MDQQASRIAAMFDALSATYDSTGVDFFQPIAHDLLRVMPPQSGERWLDIGCGRGAVTIPVAQAVGSKGQVMATDISPRMVELTRELGVQAGLSNLQVAVDDAQAPALEQRDFDSISSSLVLFFLAQPCEALACWLQLLRPGGRVGVTTFGTQDERWNDVDGVFAPYLPQEMRDARTSGAAGPFASDAAMEDLLHEAGFTDLRTVTATVPVRFANVEQWEAFSWTTGQRAMWLAIPEGKRDQVRAAAAVKLATYANADGSIEFTQGIRHTLGVRDPDMPHS